MKKILAIFNTEDNLTSINEILKNKFPKFEILTSFSGEEGVEIAKTENIDFIVLDIIAPNSIGFELIHVLKRDESTKNIPVFLLSVKKSDAISEQYGLEIGTNVILSKPIDIDEILTNNQPDLRFKESKIVTNEKSKILEKIVDQTEEEIKYQALLFANITESVISFDVDFIIESWNKGAENIYGWKAEEVIGKKFQDVLKPVFIDKTNNCELIVNQKGVVHLEAIHTCKNGKKIYVSKTKSPILNADNKPLGNVCIARDITKEKQIAINLELSEKRLNIALESNQMGFWELNLEEHLVFSTSFLDIIFGYKSLLPSWTYEMFLEHVIPEDRERVDNSFKTALSRNSIWDFNCRIRRLDGELRWIWAKGQINNSSDGKALTMSGLVQDITDRKRAETIQNIILNISNASKTDVELENFIGVVRKELGKLVNTENFFVALYDKNKDLINLPYYRDELGILTEFPARKTKTNLVIKKQTPLLLNTKAIYKLEDKGLIVRVGPVPKIWLGIPLRIKNNVIGAFAVQSYSDPNAYTKKDKEVLEIVSHQISISIERKQAENQLKIALKEAEESEASYKSIIDVSPNGIVIHRNGEVLLVNKEIVRLNGSTDENEIIGKSLAELMHPDYLENAFNRFAILYKTEAQIPYEIEKFIIKDGTIIELETTSILTNFNGEKAVLTILRDVSELIRAKEKAEESDRLKSAFLANMSHEIRTPMSGVLGFSELLKNPDLSSERQAKYIEIIEKSGRRLLNTINDIVDISKIEAGQIKASMSDVNIKSLMTEIFEFFKPEAQGKGLNFFLDYSINDQFNTIKTDSKLLNSVLVNLVKNAIKFTHTGSIEFGCKNLENAIEFYVEDTGIGVPLNRQTQIFERFIQADIEDRDVYEGSGLGLAISKSYINILGGTIAIDSVENKGSKFTVILPVNPTLKKENEINEMYVKYDEVDAYFKKLKILIAEDDEISAIYLSEILAQVCREILVANDGNEAVELFNDHKDIDLILMDIKMPYFNGYEVVEKIRKVNKEVIIIAQTSYSQTSDREKAISCGFNDYISKPILRDALLKIIKKHISI